MRPFIFLYREFDPRDFDTYVYANNIAPYEIERKFGDWRDLAIHGIMQQQIIPSFGNGIIEELRIEKLLTDAELWWMSGFFKPETTDFSDVQREIQFAIWPHAQLYK